MERTLDNMDELNLYLVANELKPTTWIIPSPNNFRFRDDIFGNKVIQDKVTRNGIEYTFTNISPRVINRFKNRLNGLGVSYKEFDKKNESEFFNPSGETQRVAVSEDTHFYVGSDDEKLEKLVSAESDEEFGLALGFPVEAVNAFGKVIDGERRIGTYESVSLAKAKKAGIELPNWLAYLSFVPEKLDLINGDVSESSQELGERYRDFVRTNNPKLARKVEKDFLRKRLPDSWEKNSKGNYKLMYKIKGMNRVMHGI